MRKIFLFLLVSNVVLAMQNVPNAKPLTIIDLDYISKEQYSELSNEKKWELFEKSRELVRNYLKIITDKNERLERVQSVLASTINDLETDIIHLQLKIEKKNSHP